MRVCSKIAFAGLLAGMLATSVQADEVNVDYDSSVDFNNFHTFQLIPNTTGPLAQNDPIMNERVQNMIIQEFVKQGMTQVTESPDLQVSYDSTTKENHVLNTMGPGVGIGLGWRRFGGFAMGGMETTTVATFTEGTLVIDAWTLDPKKMVWRGTAQESIVSDPQKTTKNIQKALDKLFEKWDHIKQNKSAD